MICKGVCEGKTTLISIHLIKGIILRRALLGANTFLSRNRLLNRILNLVRRHFIFGFYMIFHNKL